MPSVTVQTPYNEYTANGVTTVFAYTFYLLRESDLVVTVDGIARTDITVSGVGDQGGGNVTFATAPADQAAVLIERVIPLSRTIEYITNGPFPAETVNLDFNLIWMVLQQLTAVQGGVVRAPLGEALDPMVAAASRAGKFLSFDGTGSTLMSSGTGADAGLRTDLAGATGSSFVTYQRDGTGAVPRTLQSMLDEQAVSVINFGAVPGDATNDFTLVLRKVVAYCALTGIRRIFLPEGNYYCNTQPDPFTRGITLIGTGISFTVIVRNYQPSVALESFLEWNGANELGGGIEQIAIATATGRTNGIAVRLVATDGAHKPDFFRMERVDVTGFGTGTWNQPLLLDGTAAPAGSAAGQGIRDFSAKDCYFFNATNLAINLYNVVWAKFEGILTTAGGGTTGDVNVGGGTDPNVSTASSSTNVMINGLIGGTLICQNSQLVTFDGILGAGLTVLSSAINVTAIGNLAVISNSSTKTLLLPQGNYTAGANGATPISNGRIEQWGKVSFTASATAAVTFPIAFGGSANEIIPVGNVNVTGGFWPTSITNNGFTANQTGANTSTGYWRAVGPAP